MSLFFLGGQDADTLQRARSAFTNAVGEGWSNSAVLPSSKECAPFLVAGEGPSDVLHSRPALQQGYCELCACVLHWTGGWLGACAALDWGRVLHWTGGWLGACAALD